MTEIYQIWFERDGRTVIEQRVGFVSHDECVALAVKAFGTADGVKMTMIEPTDPRFVGTLSKRIFDSNE